jgi:hypothetical protein
MQDTHKSPPPASDTGSSGSKAKRQRSRFWIVSTHVITASVVIPGLAGVTAMAAVDPAGLRGNQALVVVLGFQSLGYVAGTYYSLSYLRKSTTMRDPQGCAKASIITFGILAVVGFVSHIALSKAINPSQLAALVIFYALIFFMFAKITRKGFNEMARDPSETKVS